jgi:RNA polymerase sigma-70 factor (ECF subfamily)
MDWKGLAVRHYSRLYALAWRLEGSSSNAWDLVQDTFERALRKPRTFQDARYERAWLVSVMHNLFIDRCRARRREPRSEYRPEELEQTLPGPEAMEPGPAWARVEPRTLDWALGQLERKFERTVRMHALEGRSYEEIAAELSIPKATVGTRLLRARRRLRTLLEPLQEQATEYLTC